MVVVSDTTPIITLLKINQLDLLHKLFGEVHIPTAVYNELVSNPRFQSEAETIKNCEYICIERIFDENAVALLKRATGLDLGETEAIILSDELHTDLLIMDEVKGRNVAKQMGLKITGTIGLIMYAYECGKMQTDEIEKCLEILQSGGRHIGTRYLKMLRDIIDNK